MISNVQLNFYAWLSALGNLPCICGANYFRIFFVRDWCSPRISTQPAALHHCAWSLIMRVPLWGPLGGHLCRWPCYHRWIAWGMCQEALDLERTMCTALVCRAQCSMPARLGHWQSRTSSVCSEMTGQWSDRSAMSGRKTLSPPGPMSYLCGLALRIWTSFWRREDSDGMDMWNAPMVQSKQPLTYRLMEIVGLVGPKWHGSSWQRGSAESGSSRLSTLMIDIPGDLVWDLPCVQQASYLEGGPLIWTLPLYLHVNQKSDYYDYDSYTFTEMVSIESSSVWHLILIGLSILFT